MNKTIEYLESLSPLITYLAGKKSDPYLLQKHLDIIESLKSPKLAKYSGEVIKDLLNRMESKQLIIDLLKGNINQMQTTIDRLTINTVH